VDHLIAKKHEGLTVLENLVFACFLCNSYKGDNLSGIDPQSARIVRLFNPRRDAWTWHFLWNGPTLVGLTPNGRATIAVLRINRPDAVLLRRSLLEEGVSFA